MPLNKENKWNQITCTLLYGIKCHYLILMIYTQWVECSPIVQETRVQSYAKSYQKHKKWYLMPPCLTLSSIRWGSRVKWSNPGNGVAPSSSPWCGSYWKGSLQVILDYSHQLYLYGVQLLFLLYNNHSFSCCYIVLIINSVLLRYIHITAAWRYKRQMVRSFSLFGSASSQMTSCILTHAHTCKCNQNLPCGCPCAIMVKALDCGIVISTFKLWSRCYVHF